MLHKWPQGKVLRMILLLLTLLAAFDLGLAAYAKWEVISETTDAITWQSYFIFGFLAVASLVFSIGGVLAIGFIPKTSTWLIEVEREMAKVTWPKNNEVVRSTIIIAVVTVVLAFLIFAVDFMNKTVVIDYFLAAPK